MKEQTVSGVESQSPHLSIWGTFGVSEPGSKGFLWGMGKEVTVGISWSLMEIVKKE